MMKNLHLTEPNGFARFCEVKCKIYFQFLLPLAQTAAAKFITQVLAKLDPQICKNRAKGGQRDGKKAGGIYLHSPVRFFLCI